MYQYESRTSYSMIDESGHLSIPGLVDFFQDGALFHSHDCGYDLQTLAKLHRAWLLNNWHIVINRMPLMGEKVIIKTWPYSFKLIYGFRNFTLETQAGEILAYADSHWFYFDSESGRPVAPTEEEVASYGMGEKYPMNYQSRKIKVDAPTTCVDQVEISFSQLDTNHHVNNGQYVRISHNYIPKDIPFHEFRVEYRNAAHLGDKLDVYTAENDKNYYVILEKTDHTICTIMEYKKGNE